MQNLWNSVKWNSEPSAWWTVQYEYRRSGTSMQYRFYWHVWIGSGHWYDYGLQLQLFINGVQNNVTVKGETSGSSWNKSGTTGWYTVSNKLSGTTPFYARLRDTSRNIIKRTSKVHNLAVVPSTSVLGTIGTFTVENGVTIPITKYNPAYTDNLEVLVYNHESGLYQTLKTVPAITNGTKVTFTQAELNTIYGLSTTRAFLYYRFILTSVGVGTSMKTDVVGNIGSSPPSFLAAQVVVADSNSAIVSVTGNSSVLILGKSTPKATWTVATAQKQASISKYRFEWLGQTIESTDNTGGVTFNLTASGSTTMNITAIDTRGFETTVTKTITVLEYEAPVAIIEYGRVNNYEEETHLKVDASIASIVVGGIEKNSVTIQWRSKQNEEGQTYSAWTTIQDNVDNVYTFDSNNEYIIAVKVTDAFGGTWEKLVALLKGKFPLFIDTGLNAVGINDFPKTGQALRVTGGDASLEGGATINHLFAQDVIEFANSCNVGFTPFNTGSTTTNLPNGEYAYSVGTIHKRTQDQITIILFAYNFNKIAMNTRIGNTWKGWAVLTGVALP